MSVSKDPLVSVIVPIYNAEKFLDECIQSILRQTHSNIQLILINDGSLDNSLPICKYYKSIDARVLLIDTPNSGVSAARNLGLSVADGDYIGFVDSDDFIENTMYEDLLKRLIEDDSDVCAMMTCTINSFNMQEIKSRPTLSGLDALTYMLLLKFPSSLWACLYSRDSIKGLRLNADIHFFEDFEFNFNVLLNAHRVSMCDKNYYHYRMNETSANQQEINDKRMTCLNICDLIIPKVQEDNNKLKKYTIYFRAHCVITIIVSISKSKKVKEQYYETARLDARKVIREAIFSQYVPITYKAAIVAFLTFPKLFPKLLYHMKAATFAVISHPAVKRLRQ